MGVVWDSLKSIWTRGRLVPDDALMGGVSDAVADLRTSGRTILTESWPGTAVDTLPQWHETLGVVYDPLARTQSEQQTMLAAMMTSEGSSTLAGLQAQFDKEFGGRVVVSEAYVYGITGRAITGIARTGLSASIIYALGYDVSGDIYSSTEAARVAAIIARYGPAHLTPNSLLSDPSAVEVGITGLGRTGLARTGRAS